MSDEAIAAALRVLAERRGRGKTFCPSEAARALATDWRPLMPEVRRVAGALQREGRLEAYQKGCLVRADTARGAIRLGLPEK